MQQNDEEGGDRGGGGKGNGFTCKKRENKLVLYDKMLLGRKCVTHK